jgi:hypothetical protein
MADNRRAGERTIFRGDVEGNDTLAEISRALETERRTPIAVGAGFAPPAGGQASNIPAMADLEDELLREFALYEGPRETSARETSSREPARRVEPSFEPVMRPSAPVAAAPVAPPAALEDDDDTMPPMDAGSMFRAAKPAPIVRTPSSPVRPVEAPRVEPEPLVVFSPEPAADIDVAPFAELADVSEAAVEQVVEFSGPVPDLAEWDLQDEEVSVEASSEPVVEADAEPLPDFSEELISEEIEPVFAGPVPDIDLDLDEEPVFAGPVPQIEIDDEPAALADEPVFAGPVPDFDFSDNETDISAVPVGPAMSEELEGELEQSLGALDLAPEAATEPASPFAAWKNDRLTAVESTTPSWLSSSALAPKWSPSVAEAAPAVAVESMAKTAPEKAEPELAAAAEDAGVPAADEPDVDFAGEFEFKLDEEDLISPDLVADHQVPEFEAPSVDAAPALDEPVTRATQDNRNDTSSDLFVVPDLPSFAIKPAAVAEPVAAAAGSVAAAVDPSFDMPDWLHSARNLQIPIEPVAEKNADFDLQDFEFDFDEDAIEAEVSRAVMSELQTNAAPQVTDELPFDPSAITEIEDRMPASFGNMDVPQVPDQDGETVPKPVSDFDYDIEAEMAELFALTNKPKTQAVEAQGSSEQAPAETGDADGLANEIIRSIHEAPAIPAGRAFDMAEIDAASTSFVSRYARVAAFAALVAFAGVGAAMLWRSGEVKNLAGDGAPRVIMADKSPIKEVPDEPGGKTVPNQDKAVYDRVAGKSPEVVKQGSLIANAEEPVNVAEKTLGDEGGMPADEQVPGVSTAQSDADARLPATPSEPGAGAQNPNDSIAPRKVKTMIVLPNGTLVARETNAPADPAPQQKPAAADAAMTAPAGTVQAEASQPAATIAPANGTPAAQGAQQAAADKMAAPKPASAPIPTARPADQPVNVVGTVTQRGNVVGQQTAVAEKPAAQQTQAAPAAKPQATAPVASNVPAGAYVIQIASLPSEAEAQKSFANLSAKFSSVIGGKSPDIKPAEIPGKGTYYRLRIVAGSKDDAIALCTRYKAAGGSCLVSR